MALNFGPHIMAIPGPSVMPERVLRAMHRASPNIYEGELIDLTATIYPDLKRVARTTGSVAIYIANGHGAWEAALRNTLIAGDKVLVLSTGRFAAGWGELATSMGIDVEVMDFGMHAAVDTNKVTQRLTDDTNNKIKAVLTVQTDTASSVINDIPAIRSAIDDASHEAMFMVDCIASLACDKFEMDDWGVDLTVAACQKGLMTPAGISFVYFNDKAEEASKRAQPGGYWDWKPRAYPEIYYQHFGGTAPTHHLYGLREALDILLNEEGIEAAWDRHTALSHAVHATLEAWGNNGKIHHNIENHHQRSHAVSTVTTDIGDAARIRKWCEETAGLTLGIGLGFGQPGSDEWNRRFRIGHMGHQNIPSTLSVLGTIDCALKALNIEHGENALANATQSLAQHVNKDAP